jgi:hypothetical protein
VSKPCASPEKQFNALFYMDYSFMCVVVTPNIPCGVHHDMAARTTRRSSHL